MSKPMTYEFEESGLPEEENKQTAENGAPAEPIPENPDAAPENKKKEEEKLPFVEQCYLLLHDLVYILAFITIFFVFAIRMVSVEGTSMEPTLKTHDQMLLVSNVFYNDEDIQVGDIVVALAPRFDDDPIIKRVIAVAGQTVDIDFNLGIVYVDGVALEEDYILEPTHQQFGGNGVQFPMTISEGHVFVLGDNRNGSSDSRLNTIGQIDTDYILGKAFAVIFPGVDDETKTRDFGRIGFID